MRGGPQQVNTVRRAGPGKMATVKRGWWEEDEALACHRMLSLHQMFELVGSQLSQADVEALTFLLDEAYPLRQAAWAAAGRKDEEEEEEKAENSAWDTIRLHRPKSGERLLYELERRGLCDEANFGNLLQLLRVITRHDLLSYVCQKRGRAVSPERCTYGRPASGIGNQMESCLNSGHTDSARRSWESAAPSSKQHSVGRRKGRAAGKRRGRRSNGPSNREVTKQAPLLQKATCGWLSCTPTSFMMWPQKFLVGDKRVCLSDKDSSLRKCSDTRIAQGKPLNLLRGVEHLLD
ncbi:death effector domain-containing 1 isoform X3 [Narcine bancroftii]|uniref:death effector domain-containing 1 isoform X3 n=1 Tax=Narcine bancroftii TaxID=1343680 RepID=UPI003832098C